MATQNLYAGDGTANQVFNLTFEYLDDSDIRVEIKDTTSDAVAVQITKDATNGWELITPTSIRMKGTLQPASTDNVRIYRETDISSKAVTYAAGSAIRAQDLNKANDQVIFSVEEWRDQRVPLYNAVLPDDVNMGGNQIVNLGAANSDDDAVNREQLGNLIAQDISDDTAQGLQINKSTGGSNSNDLATFTIRDSSKTQKGSVTINEGEGIDVTYTNGDAVISGEDSSKSNKGVVSINEGEGIDVTYTNGDAVISGEDSSKTNKGVVSINEAHGIGVTYTNGDAVISADKSTASQQGVIQITPAADAKGNPIQFVRPADGELTLGIPDNSIDLDKIKDLDIITETEQDQAIPPVSDTNLLSAKAAAKRNDVIYQATGVNPATPSPGSWQTGKLLYDASVGSEVLKLWNGSNWVNVSTGVPSIPLTSSIIRYVDATNGSDAVGVTGFSPLQPLASIKRAVELINTNNADGSVVVVAPGVYQETLPIQIERKNISIVGTALRSCFVQPTQATETNTMFEVNTGTLLANMTFVGLKASGTRGNSTYDGDATYGLPENQGWCAAFYAGATIKKSPYIQNCTSFNDSSIDNSIKYDQTNLPAGGLGGDQTSAMSGGGILCDGNVPATSSPLRSFVVDSFTQINLDGPGILVTNSGYAQLVSFFGTFCHYHAKALNGGQINLSNCTTDFGRYGLIADGRSNAKITGSSVGTTAANATSITVDGLTLQNNFFSNQPGSTMVMEVGGESYQVLSASAVSSNTSTINIYRATNADPNTNLGFKAQINDNSAVTFKLRSYISTGGHTFEYVGSGTDYSAHPDYGGIAVEANQVIELGGDGTSDDQIYNRGKVWQSSTDENGKFKVGDKFQVDQRLGTITLDGYTVAAEVVSDSTPQLGGDLDLNNNDITGTGNINISGNITANGGSLTNLNASNLTSGTVAAARLGSGTADATTFLRGDNSWQVVNTALVNDTNPQLGADLDIQGFDITTATTNGNIDLTANGTGLIRVTENGLSQVPIVTQHDIGTAANEIPLNQYLGTAAFQDSSNFSVGNLVVNTEADIKITGAANGSTTDGLTIDNDNSHNGDNLTTRIRFTRSGNSGTQVYSTIDSVRTGTHDTDIVFSTNYGAALYEELRIKANGGICLNGENDAAHTFDDYEEGTFTPTITAGYNGVSFNTGYPNGNYTKIGDLVFIVISMYFSSTGHVTSARPQVGGLPFTAHQSPIHSFGGVLNNSFTTIELTSHVSTSWYIAPNGVVATLFANNGNSFNSYPNANASNDWIQISGCYKAA